MAELVALGRLIEKPFLNTSYMAHSTPRIHIMALCGNVAGSNRMIKMIYIKIKLQQKKNLIKQCQWVQKQTGNVS